MSFIPEKDYKLTPGKEQLTVERKTSLAVEPVVGSVISKLREKIDVTNSAVVSASFSQTIIGTGTTPNSHAKITTKRRAEYISGFSGEFGIGIIVPTTMSSDQYIQWGYYDNNDGLGAGVDVTGSYFFRKVNGTTIKTHQQNWNKDVLDGSGSSGLNLSLSDGVICEIDFTWYGLGDITLSYRIFDSGSNERREIEAHREIVSQSLSFNIPNQPITVEANNGSTSEDIYAIIGGRQVTFFGKSEIFERPVATYVTGVLVDSTLPMTLATFTNKENFGQQEGLQNSIQTSIKDISFTSDQPIVYQVVYGISGSGIDKGDFVDPPYTSVSESVINYQLTGSNWPGEQIVISTGFVGGANSPNSKNVNLGNDTLSSLLILGEGDVIQIRAAKLSASDATVSFAVEWSERW